MAVGTVLYVSGNITNLNRMQYSAVTFDRTRDHDLHEVLPYASGSTRGCVPQSDANAKNAFDHIHGHGRRGGGGEECELHVTQVYTSKALS